MRLRSQPFIEELGRNPATTDELAHFFGVHTLDGYARGGKIDCEHTLLSGNWHCSSTFRGRPCVGSEGEPQP
jgi:hypothetical protein